MFIASILRSLITYLRTLKVYIYVPKIYVPTIYVPKWKIGKFLFIKIFVCQIFALFYFCCFGTNTRSEALLEMMKKVRCFYFCHSGVHVLTKFPIYNNIMSQDTSARFAVLISSWYDQVMVHSM